MRDLFFARTAAGLGLCACIFFACAQSGPRIQATASQPSPSSDARASKNGTPKLEHSPILAGVDADGNGIRDDVDGVIAAKHLPSGQKQSVEQLARSLQRILLLDLSVPNNARNNPGAMEQAVNCMSAHFAETKQRWQVLSAVEKATFNTKARVRHYDAYNQALSGTVSKLPSGDTCEK